MILQNAAVCKKCGDEIWSEHRHDFRECHCGAIAVDGGSAYLRRVGDLDAFDDRSIVVPEDMKEELKAAVEWAKDTGRNDLGTALAVIRVLQKRGVVGAVDVSEVEVGRFAQKDEIKELKQEVTILTEALRDLQWKMDGLNK